MCKYCEEEHILPSTNEPRRAGGEIGIKRSVYTEIFLNEIGGSGATSTCGLDKTLAASRLTISIHPTFIEKIKIDVDLESFLCRRIFFSFLSNVDCLDGF